MSLDQQEMQDEINYNININIDQMKRRNNLLRYSTVSKYRP